MAKPNLSSVDISGIVKLILEIVLAAIPIIDAMTQRVGKLDGKAKQSTVVDLVRRGLAPAWPNVGPDVALDARVEAATRVVIDAVVRLQTAVAAAQDSTGS